MNAARQARRRLRSLPDADSRVGVGWHGADRHGWIAGRTGQRPGGGGACRRTLRASDAHYRHRPPRRWGPRRHRKETDLGGSLHFQRVLILSAFLAARYTRHQPLSLTASLVFEQSYAPVEGDDSASLAGWCAVVRARRHPDPSGLAITGSMEPVPGRCRRSVV